MTESTHPLLGTYGVVSLLGDHDVCSCVGTEEYSTKNGGVCMLLNGDDILKARAKGEIVIDPFDHHNVNSGSCDVTLGPFYYVQPRRPPVGVIYDYQQCYNPYDTEHVRDAWLLQRAVRFDTLPPLIQKTAGSGITPNDYVIRLGPKEIILAHTMEFVGSVPQADGASSITTQMHSRSSTVRNCVDVCGSGGWGDHGYCSRWTMEIVNASREHRDTLLVVGRRIAQISFFRTNPIQRDYAVEGKYHDRMSLEQLRRQWHPQMMLPKTPQDREVAEGTPHLDQVEKLLSRIEG